MKNSTSRTLPQSTLLAPVKKTLSPGMNGASEHRTFPSRDLRIRSEQSARMQPDRDASNNLKWYATKLEKEVVSRAGISSFRTDGRRGLWPNTNWYGVNPRWLSRQFLARMTCFNVKSSAIFGFWAIVLSSISEITPLCLSHSPLLQGL